MIHDRRKTTQPRLTITQILDKIQRIADEEFNGDIGTHTLEIFEQLNTNDKRTLLRKGLYALWERQIEHAREGVHEIVIEAHDDTSQTLRIDRAAVQEERKSLESVSMDEQIKLKTWLTKAFFILGIIAFITLFVMTHVFDFASKDSVKELLQHIEEVAGFVKP